MPDDCDKANRTFELLRQATGNCFIDGNIPINSVAQRIRNDAGHLHKVIKHLERDMRLGQHQHNTDNDDVVLNYPFNFSEIKAIININNKWCNY